MGELIVSEGTPKVSIVKVAGIGEMVLPATALELWDRGELHDLLNLPHDGTKVEIIDGTIVVTTAPHFGHNSIATQITKAIVLAGGGESSWEVVQSTGVLFPDVGAGYIPEVVLVESGIFDAATQVNTRRLTAGEIEMAIEITSEGNAASDRKGPAEAVTKWRGYARMEIPYYLLVDRDPKVARTTLYSIPDPGTGAYLNEDFWAFGEPVHLPEPFDLRIPTDGWNTWV